ncbi:MAG: ABC transporter ATP-binding protein [Anaerolineae bacterium]
MSSLIEMHRVSKLYPNGVLANDRVDFTVEKGEIHALVGENGAGKTTLMKILYGMEMPTEGEIWLRGQRVYIRSPIDAIRQGIGMVHQNFMLIPSFTVAQNIVLGREPLERGFVDYTEAQRITESLSKEYGLKVEPDATIDSIPVGMRQRVEILKALHWGAEILILDEPTAVLTPQETRELFTAIHKLTERGKTVIFITHKLREVKEISDRVTVMRNGRVMGTLKTVEASETQIARMMVGREVFMVVDKPPVQRGEVVLQVRDLTHIAETGHVRLRNVSFNVYASEILGVAGVEGNGQTELVEVLAGLRPATFGTATVDSQSLLNHTPRRVRELGVSHIPEDRLTYGVALGANVAENIVVDRYYRPPFTRNGFLNVGFIMQFGNGLIRQFSIMAPDAGVPVQALSGGNMQKVVVAREFSSQPRLLIAAQPTRGIDVGATEFVHQQLIQKRSEGCAILLVSADLNEVMSLSDRIVVMYNGAIVGVFPDAQKVSEEELGAYMLGLKKQDPAEMEAYL